MFSWLSDAKEYLTTPSDPWVWGDSETVGSTNYDLAHRDDDVEEEPRSKYRSCVPDTQDVTDSAIIGCLGGALGSAAGGPIVAAAGCVAGGATGAAVQMYADSKKIQKCMDEEDKEEDEDLLSFASKPNPIVPRYKQGSWQYAVAYNKNEEERHKNGLGGITCWEYDAILDQGLNPSQPGGLANVENSVLCPHGGKNNSQGYGAHGGDTGGGGGEGHESSGGGYSNGGGGGGDLMNIIIDCDGKGTQSNGDGASSCKM